MSTPAPVGPYSPIRRAGGFLYCSGQIGQEEGTLMDGFEPQLRQVFENLKAVFASEGARLEDIVKTTVFLTDMAHYKEMNAIYVEYFSGNPPARSAVQVAGLPLGALVEIEAVAYVG